jgi:hypothetical protein
MTQSTTRPCIAALLASRRLRKPVEGASGDAHWPPICPIQRSLRQSSPLASNPSQGDVVCVGVLFFDFSSTPATMTVADGNGNNYTVDMVGAVSKASDNQATRHSATAGVERGGIATKARATWRFAVGCRTTFLPVCDLPTRAIKTIGKLTAASPTSGASWRERLSARARASRRSPQPSPAATRKSRICPAPSPG